MELTTGKQLHLGNYPKNINNNKQLLRIWIELRAAKKKKTKHNETLWLKLSLHLFITVLMISIQLYFFRMQWHFSHPPLQEIHTIYSIQ